MASGDAGRDRFEELAEDYVARRRRGETPSVDEYAAAHPAEATLIRELFPTLDLVERAIGRDADVAAADAAAGPASFPGLTVLREIAPGVGGFGRVYQCREASLDRIVAVKTLQAHVRTPEGRATFEREARAAAGLDHPHILEVHSFHPDHQPPYLVMKYVDGAPLLAACEGRDAMFVAGVVEKVARALDFSHAHGVVHRDVKPDNILVDRTGEPHVTDFGLAKPLDVVGDGGGGGAVPDVSGIKGTPRFIAPEVYEGRGSGGPRADVYALGVTLYTVLCRRPPFGGTSFGEIRDQVLAAEPPFPQDVDPDIPEPLQRICLKAMERDPADRYESAGAMAADLQRFRTGQEVTARPRRYLRELRGRLRTHIAEIGVWRERKLIDVSWMDRLTRPYVWLLAREPPTGGAGGVLATGGPFRWDLMLLRLGGVLMLVTTVLWPAFYWRHLSPAERIAAVAAPALLLNAVGWWAHRRGNLRGTVAFLTVGMPLVPLFVGVLLTEAGLCASPEGPCDELFPNAGTADSFAPTNLQLTLAMTSLAGYALFALLRVRSRAFAAWFGVSTYLLLTCVLLLGGLRRCIDNEQVGGPLLLYATLAFSFVPFSRMIRRVEDGRWSSVLYTFFPVPFVAAMTGLALAGVRQLGADPHAGWEDPDVQHWLMANTAVHLIGAYRCSRADVRFARYWAPFFLALVPLSLLTPVNVLFTESPDLFVLGARPFTIHEALAAVVGVACIAAGTRLRRWTVLASGLVGTAVFVVRATDRHFEDTLGWPLALAVTGALALAAGATLAWWRMHHDPDATE
jgi:predicted Ser/Thr protein kinase